MILRSHFLAFTFWMTLLTAPVASLSTPVDPLVVTVSDTYPPFTQIDINGQPAGMFVDIWNLWAKKTGREVTFQATDWVGTLTALKNGEADIHSGLYFSEKRAQWMDYSQAFYSNQSSFYHRIDDTPLPSDSTLEGVKIGVIKGYLQETFLREAYAKAKVLTFTDDRELIKALASGAIDLFLSEDPTIETLLAETGMMGRIGSVGAPVQTNDLYAGVLDGRTDLLKDINDGFEQITPTEWAEIETRWIKDPTKRFFGRDIKNRVELSALERAWIASNPVIRTIALKDWPPVDFKGSDGGHMGIAADILMLAADRAGLKVEPQFGPWADMLTKLQDGEIDLAPEIYYTEERAKVLAYSRPFLPLYNAIFVGSNVRGIKGISDLIGRNVAVEKGYAMEGMLKSDYPGIKSVLVNSTLDALRKVSIGEVDAYIGSQYVASYLIDQNLLHGIKPVAHFGEKPQFLHMAVSKDRAILRDIMDKALGSISEAEKRTIIGRYVAPTTFMLAASGTTGSIDLTDEEKSWLEKNPVIRIANETDWSPFDYVENGKPVGFSIDMISKVANLVGLDVEFVNGFIWSELVNKFLDGSIDVLPAVYVTPERGKTMDFTSGYAVNPPALALLKERTELNSLEDLKGLKLAVLSDTSFDQLLKERYPDIIRVPIDGAVQGMEAVAFGQADGFIESLSVASVLMEKNLLSNIRLVRVDGLQKKGENDLRMATKKSDTVLRDILQKGLDVIDRKTKSELFEKHFAANKRFFEITPTSTASIDLTGEERKWLEDHPQIRFAGDPNWLPYEYFNSEGEYDGIVSDFLSLIEQRIGVQFNRVTTQTWSESLDLAMAYEVDMISESPGSIIEPRFDFTTPYIASPVVIVGKKDSSFISSLDELIGKKIGVVEGYGYVQEIVTRFPDLSYVMVQTVDEGMESVAVQETDVFLVTLALASYTINERSLGNAIEVVGRTDVEMNLSFGVRNDWLPLIEILNKAIKSISVIERQMILAKWSGAEPTVVIDYTLVGQVAGGAFLILIGFLYWNRTMVVEIKKRQIVEENLREAKAVAEEATKAKATFLASMSHEIRTPMNGVIGMVALLRQTKLVGEQKQMLETISDSGQSLLTIINDILDFSKIEAGKMDLEQIPFSILDVVEGASQTIAANATKKGLRLITYIEPDLPQFVMGDPVRIRQIIINLGGNAIKFTKEGQVVIRADRVESNDDQKITIRFSVIDQGIGLSDEGQAKLFKAYSQADSSTTREFGGTGLGLTICKTLTGLMGGEIGVNSELGEGAEFFSIIPFNQSDKKVEVLKTVDISDLRVLLINNNRTELSILQHYLEHWEITVETNDNMQSVVSHCQTALDDGTPFDVVVFGPQWTQKELIAVVDAVKEIGLKTRFVFLTHDKQQRAQKDLNKGVYVDVDPIRRATFISAVAVAAGRESPEVNYEEEVEDLTSVEKALSVEEARKQGSLILVAEDNATNRDVIGRQLNLLGYTCEMAEDGEKALNAWRSNNYGILLTDCNMPIMDGFELTNAIRKDEEGTNTHSKIIAITANALQGEAERCLESGMDDYMSKPIDMTELREKLHKWMPHTKETSKQYVQDEKIVADDTPLKGSNGPIDENALKTMFGDDEDMFREILVDFIEPSKGIIKEIQIGFEQHSAENVKQGAHKLKSSALSIGAVELGELCQILEEAGKNDDWDVIDNSTPKLEKLMFQVEEYVSQL
jgi:ABC-type amino acid transport substrate-binding protein/CheY-like chemotaxis protein/nitrogen-specific signal transduction histidine kinase/HPt (histidine-containing phosphotransfer) domain-containing protein